MKHLLLAAALTVLLTACGPVPSPGPTTTPSPTTSATASQVPVASPSASGTWAPTSACGHERWAVKTGTDPDARRINLAAATVTTIAALTSIPAPASLPSDSRIAPVETTVYRVNATLTAFKQEADSDIHLVLSDGQGHTMIAEVPDPACVGQGSPLLGGIEQARSQFDARFTASSEHFTSVNIPVTVTGVGFFDFQHGQDGVAPDGIELHPVLQIQFGG